MDRDIEYGEDIVVGVVRDGSFCWYVTTKELWFLDRNKWADAFRVAGSVVEDDHSERFGIAVVNEVTAEAFLAAINGCRVDAQNLQELLAKKVQDSSSREEGEGYEELAPALLVDFDQRCLISMFPEPSSFEKFVPDGWIGKYASFIDAVPPDQRYWIVDGRDMFGFGVE